MLQTYHELLWWWFGAEAAAPFSVSTAVLLIADRTAELAIAERTAILTPD